MRKTGREREEAKNTWSEGLKDDLLTHHLTDVRHLDREIWRQKIEANLGVANPGWDNGKGKVYIKNTLTDISSYNDV